MSESQTTDSAIGVDFRVPYLQVERRPDGRWIVVYDHWRTVMPNARELPRFRELGVTPEGLATEAEAIAWLGGYEYGLELCGG